MAVGEVEGHKHNAFRYPACDKGGSYNFSPAGRNFHRMKYPG